MLKKRAKWGKPKYLTKLDFGNPCHIVQFGINCMMQELVKIQVQVHQSELSCLSPVSYQRLFQRFCAYGVREIDRGECN